MLRAFQNPTGWLYRCKRWRISVSGSLSSSQTPINQKIFEYVIELKEATILVEEFKGDTEEVEITVEMIHNWWELMVRVEIFKKYFRRNSE